MEKLTPDALRARIHAAIGEPEITGRGFDLGAAPADGRRRWWLGQGSGAAPTPVRAGAVLAVVVAVASAVTVGTVLHLRSLPKPAGSRSGPAGPATHPPASAVPTLAVGPPVTAADGFLPQDVTAVSADQWWVLGHDTAGCTGAALLPHPGHPRRRPDVRLHPHPARLGHRAALPGPRGRLGLQLDDRLVHPRRRRELERRHLPSGMTIEDLETSGSYVYAVVCASALRGVRVLDAAQPHPRRTAGRTAFPAR